MTSEENNGKINLPVLNKESSVLVEPKKLPTDKFHISYSEFVDWNDCSYRHKLKHINKIDLDKPSEHTEFGGIIHEAIENYLLSKKDFDFSEIESKVRNALLAISSFKKEEVETWVKAVSPMLTQLPTFLADNFPNFELVSAEYELMESLEKKKDRYFKGFIDVILKYDYTDKRKKNPEVEQRYVIADWKGQRLSSPILTPNGWTTMGELKIGDKISSSNGKHSTVEAIYPLGKKDVYRVWFRDGSFVDTTNDHLWSTYSVSNSKPRVLTTEQLMTEKYYRYLAVPKPIVFANPNKFVIDPYLLGILLGDGCLRTNVRFSTNDSEILQNVSGILNKGTNLKKIGKSKYDYSLTVSQKGFNPRIKRNKNYILDELRSLNLLGKLSYEKFVPHKYLLGTVKQRLSILQGLLDTDGWVQKGIPKFSTTSPQLAADIKHLVGSLGGVAFVCTRKKKRNVNFVEKTEYIVTVRLPEGMVPFRLSRKLEKWNSNPKYKLWRKISKVELLKEKDEMQCIGVSAKDHLYITDDFILTHNTTSWGWTGDKKRDPIKQMQLVLYKHFWAKKNNIPIDKVKCAWVLLKRDAKPGQHIELVPISVGEKAIEKALENIYRMVNSVEKQMFSKNRNSCRFCQYSGTQHCT